MLENSFCCFKGISETGETRLWQVGIKTWQDFDHCCRIPMREDKIALVRAQISEARIALKANLLDYFINRLPGIHKIRALSSFNNKIGYLDIETNGLSAKSYITSISVWDGKDFHLFVKGVNQSSFLSLLSKLSMIVTFNGSRFDLPQIVKTFRIDIHKPHLDLLPLLHEIGLSGGLKKIEKQLGIARQSQQEMDGIGAIKLWQDYLKFGQREFLQKLLEYNAQDTLSLQKLALMLIDWSMAAMPGYCKSTVRIKPVIRPVIDKFLEQHLEHNL